MEQKRTIWIVLAAGIFLSVVLGAAVILYASEAKKNTTALYQRSAGSVWMSPETVQQKHTESFSNEIDFPSEPPAEESSINPAEVNNSSVTSNIESPAEGKTSIENSDSKIAQTDNVTVISTGNTSVYNVGDTSTTTIDLNALKNTASASSNVTAQNKAAETAIRETNAVHRNVEKTSPVVEKKISSPKASASSNKKSVSSKSSAHRLLLQNLLRQKKFPTDSGFKLVLIQQQKMLMKPEEFLSRIKFHAKFLLLQMQKACFITV